jgi:hypothetical protein
MQRASGTVHLTNLVAETAKGLVTDEIEETLGTTGGRPGCR